MAVLNLTPDSFSDGGRLHLEAAAAIERGAALIAEGADILDLGAESTRPGAAPVDEQEEWRRLQPVLAGLRERGLDQQSLISVDTRHLAVARAAAEAGVGVINLPFPQDLTQQGGLDEVRAMLGRFQAIVLMHSRGTPATMSQLCHYDDVVATVIAELRAVADRLCPEGGGRVIFDPGLGFAKTAAQSLALLGQVGRLARELGGPVLIGASRKSFLGHVSGLPVGERLAPSLAAAVLAAQQGAAVVRVHDVAQTRAALAVVAAMKEAAA